LTFSPPEIASLKENVAPCPPNWSILTYLNGWLSFYFTPRDDKFCMPDLTGLFFSTKHEKCQSPQRLRCLCIMHRLPSQDLRLQHKHRSEEHTSELQSRFDLVCRLLLEKKK